ncbi:alpha/beta hydrolase family protein [Hyphomonas chukchiensis]|uniref:Peptidase S9 prolyl oligopeptidase catalytic domain-containing protein n=1 Tax=Hyphomonas chukchiensis TaxID=1280947 RepID=A0A062UDT1_9PROT|nr:alpha/beta fold hydrolase [Hyphomonas chukchiensis]KCZ54270.1 hypothetical protein HY30_19140 [Hyphomonas chukchiensis]|tara:strand:+ start:743 stop:1564 length:822 start_codon:yes stop_codon:yes gene_type:complete
MAGSVQQDISYPGAKGPVSGLLFEAVGERTPALLFLHWGFGDRFSFAREAAALAECGVTCLTIDAPGMGARGKGLPPLDRSDIAIAYVRECIDDLKAGIDYLAARPHVDPDRLGYVGHSLGGALAGQFVAADPRLYAAVIMAGPGQLAPVWSLRPDDAYRLALQPYDGEQHIGRSKARLLFQVAARDVFVTADNAQSLYEAATGTKEIRQYEATHALNDAARVDRAQWLAETLGFSAHRNDSIWHAARLPRRDLIKHRLVSAVMSVMRRRDTD